MITLIVPPNVFNTESANFTGKEQHAADFDDILDSLTAAVASRDSALFARQATRSAEINQRYVPNPIYQILKHRLEEFNALGINVGHTGTVVGILFDNDPAGYKAAMDSCRIISKEMAGDVRVEVTTTPASPL